VLSHHSLAGCAHAINRFNYSHENFVFIYAGGGGGNLGTTPAGLNIQLRLIMWRKKIYGSRNYGWHLSKSSGHVG
jgi:hypothetical protein